VELSGREGMDARDSSRTGASTRSEWVAGYGMTLLCMTRGGDGTAAELVSPTVDKASSLISDDCRLSEHSSTP
jgi:hypothetical protein